MVYQRVIEQLKMRKKRIEEGKVNCIPLNFSRFRGEWPGIEQGRYYLVTGQTKSAKTQVANYIFVYNVIFYAFNNPDKVHPKIFYYPLEETPEEITLRFMAYCLYTLSNGEIRISPTDLKSTNESKPLSQKVIDILESDEYKKIFEFYESVVEFKESRNPTGVWKDAKAYAETHSTPVYKEMQFKDKFEPVKVVDYYKPNDPDEYFIIIVDHVSLLETEKGMDLRESINKLSEYGIILRNKFNYIPVFVQQQSTETSNLEAFKNNKIRPTQAGLSDSKYTAKDCNMMLGITNPYSFELPSYLGYDIRLLKDKARFLEIVVNRNGQANGICPLYFDGATNFFRELPLPNDKESLQKVYDTINSLGKKSITLLLYSVKNWVNNLFNQK